MENIFIGNISPTTTEENLRDLFGRFGSVVSVTVVTDRDSGAPRGIAFVEMNSEAEAQQAIAAINGNVIDGHCLVVNEARPKNTSPNAIDTHMRHHRDHRY